MNRQVIVLPRAESQLLEASLWWSENRSMEQALRWLAGFEEALSLLETDIRKLTIAPEDELLDPAAHLRPWYPPNSPGNYRTAGTCHLYSRYSSSRSRRDLIGRYL